MSWGGGGGIVRGQPPSATSGPCHSRATHNTTHKLGPENKYARAIVWRRLVDWIGGLGRVMDHRRDRRRKGRPLRSELGRYRASLANKSTGARSDAKRRWLGCRGRSKALSGKATVRTM